MIDSQKNDTTQKQMHHNSSVSSNNENVHASHAKVKPHKRYISYLLAFLLITCIAVWLGGGILTAPQPTLPDNASERQQAIESQTLVLVENATIEKINEVIEISGQTTASRAITLRSSTTGRIVELGAKKGESVSKDQRMIRLDSRELSSNIIKTNAQVRESQVNYNSLRALQKKGLASELEVLHAQSQLQSAKAAQKAANEAMEDTKILAPFAAIVTQQSVEIGDYLTPGNPLFTLADISPTLVSASLSEQELAKLGEQRPQALVELSTGESYFGQLTYVAPAADQASKTFDIEITLETIESSPIRLGVTSEIYLQLNPVEALRITPSQLSLSSNGDLAIKVVDANNRIASIPITTIRTNANFVWVQSENITPKTKIVVSGAGFTKEGEQVQIRNISNKNEQ